MFPYFVLFHCSCIAFAYYFGVCITSILSLNEFPLGGRLRHCIQNWKKVCSSSRGLDVVSSGNNIPFKFVPALASLPKNPEVSGPAHDILVQEAADFLFKEAVAPVDPVAGHFVSSYLAVTKPHTPGKFRPILHIRKVIDRKGSGQ